MAYTPDAYNVDRPTGGDLVAVPEELRGIKERIGAEVAGKMSQSYPIQKIYPTTSSGQATTANTDINLANGTYQNFRVVADVAFSISVPTTESGYVPYLTLRLTNGGNHNVTWPSGTRWSNGAPPVLTPDGVDVIVMFKPFPSATIWEAALVMQNLQEPS